MADKKIPEAHADLAYSYDVTDRMSDLVPQLTPEALVDQALAASNPEALKKRIAERDASFRRTLEAWTGKPFEEITADDFKALGLLG